MSGQPREVIERAVDFGTAELIPDRYRPAGWTVAVDGVAQSYVDLTDPTVLPITYTTWIAKVLDLHRPPHFPVSAVFVGGGGCTLPRYLAATRPDSTQTVFELDGRLVDLLREHLDLDGVPGLQVQVQDGGAGVRALPGNSADVVVLDVFRGGAMVIDFATVEFLHEVRRVLRPGGVCTANVWDAADLGFALRVVASAREVFPHVLAFAEPGVLMKQRPGSMVIAASTSTLPTAELVEWATSTDNEVCCLNPAQLAAVCGTATPLTAANPLAGRVTEVERWGRGSRFT